MVLQRGHFGQSFPFSRAKILFNHSYLSESPFKELSHETGGKYEYMVTVHGAPRGRNVYKQWGTAWFPKEIVYENAITARLP